MPESSSSSYGVLPKNPYFYFFTRTGPFNPLNLNLKFMPEFSEKDIIAGCKKNNRVFQEYLYKQYYSLFLKVCCRYARDIQDAEQLMHDGFIKIFNHIHDFENKGSFEGWMRRIMVNTCLDYLKSKYVKNSMQLYFSQDMSESHKFSIQNNALDKMALKELLGIIQTLPPMSKMVFNLFVFDGYSHKEISHMLEISEGTSQWHVNNARKSLQQKINKQEEHQEKKTKVYEQK